mmetsp:Transcript_7353/g.11069  ORF Transcript_7353/g.11069 Transcript_7353/m.11069 type:complete len:110 (-) Transcript_7353:35-364(-)
MYFCWVVEMSAIFGPQIVRGERGCSDAWRALLDDLFIMLLLLLLLLGANALAEVIRRAVAAIENLAIVDFLNFYCFVVIVVIVGVGVGVGVDVIVTCQSVDAINQSMNE